MICPKCNVLQPDGVNECQECGIVFAKYFERERAFSAYEKVKPLRSRYQEEESLSIMGFARDTLFFVDAPINMFYFGGRVIAFLIAFVWGWKFILASVDSNYVGASFMHLVNLPFHEAGHILFRPSGQFLMMLGGSIGQVLMPFICFLVLLLKTRDPFGASISLWWVGESLMDLAPYINDARALKLILLGGVTGKDVEDYHDWEFILRKLHWLHYDHTLAQITNTLGIILMLSTFVWGGYLLVKQYRNLG